jgi:hypothetical protein
MPKPSPKLSPAFEKAVSRMLATPPQPKKAVKQSRRGKTKVKTRIGLNVTVLRTSGK